MKTKYMIWITALLLFVTGCGKEPLTPAPPPPTPTPPPTELSKQWHLVGFVHAADSTVTPPGRMACKGCFSLALGADGTISGQGFLTVFAGSYRVHNGDITLEGIGGAADGEQPDGKQYIEALRTAVRYEILSARRMRLYYNGGKDYLLFREWGEADSKIPAALLDNMWKLSGFVRTADGVVQEVQSGNCGRCYSMQMLSNGVIAGRTSANEIHGNFEVWGDQIRIDRFFAVQPTRDEPTDGKRYIATMPEVTRYEVKDGQLKLYYNDDENYLLFRAWKESKEEIIPEAPPAELLGRTWRLLGFGGPFDYAVREPRTDGMPGVLHADVLERRHDERPHLIPRNLGAVQGARRHVCDALFRQRIRRIVGRRAGIHPGLGQHIYVHSVRRSADLLQRRSKAASAVLRREGAVVRSGSARAVRRMEVGRLRQRGRHPA